MAESKEANTSTECAQYMDPDFLRAMLIGLTIDCPLNKSLDQCYPLLTGTGLFYMIQNKNQLLR
ncbi:MAG: hypothetical protein PF440_12140 [Thiomicrorhabdus sp.]|jgi:hypothetical protein|nr:hypothetical protein [Thiomicrorhabdus sp.]